MAFGDWLSQANSTINTLLWDSLGLVLLIATGIGMTCLTGWFQLTHIRHWLGQTLGSLWHKKQHSRHEKGAISPFQAVCTALASSVGVGNIAGVAAAIAAGGPGAVLWMWVAAFFGMMTSYSEAVLGVYYRRKVGGEWTGGAMYYLQDGLGGQKGRRIIGRVLAVLFACFTVLASFGIGNMAQVNKIVSHIESAFPLPRLSAIRLYEGVSLYALLIGAVLMLTAGAILLGGTRRIATAAERIVPTMILLYVLGSLGVIGSHHRQILPALGGIAAGAFTGKAAWGGAVGITLRQVITTGFKRGVFSNEAGLGSSVIAHAGAAVREPAIQGMWGIFQVFVDTMVVCTMTALVVLTGGTVMDSTPSVAAAFRNTYGPVGEQFIAVAILLFAFTTVLGWSQYGAKAAEYLGGSRARRVYTLLFIVLILSGALLTSSVAWDISDTFNGMMMLPNLIGVLALSGQVRRITHNYIERTFYGKSVPPILSYDARIQRQMAEKEDDG